MSPSEFLASGRPNMHVEYNDYRLYLRSGGYHLIGDKGERCLDLASVEIDEDKGGKGNFAGVLAHLIGLARQHGIAVLFVENLLNERLASYLERYGMTRQGNSNPPCYYLRLD